MLLLRLTYKKDLQPEKVRNLTRICCCVVQERTAAIEAQHSRLRTELEQLQQQCEALEAEQASLQRVTELREGRAAIVPPPLLVRRAPHTLLLTTTVT